MTHLRDVSLNMSKAPMLETCRLGLTGWPILQQKVVKDIRGMPTNANLLHYTHGKPYVGVLNGKME